MEVVLWVYTLVCIPHRQFHAEGATMCIQLIWETGLMSYGDDGAS